MNGLINRALEWFVRDTFGEALWREIVAGLALGEAAFEPLMSCGPEVTDRLLAGVAARIGRAPEDLLEDLGTYLVSQPRTEAVRRLLRFGGVDFIDFLHSLEDLPDRARLALPEFALPDLRLLSEGAGLYRIELGIFPQAGLRFGPVLVGVLRAMADDYGALVLIGLRRADARHEVIEVRLLDAAFSNGRSFELGAGPVVR
ncbi:MAG: heme NO-binding domain-containing protein [Roseovarius sp.]|nr:heme NO-binding domain-containing protein [Roseovarius sp.]